MKLGLCLVLLISFAIPALSFDQTHSAYASVLKQFVKNGMVDYAGLKQNSKDLDAYLHQAASVTESEFKSWTTAQQMAFLINVYNAQTMHLVIDYYPVKSIRDIKMGIHGPWDMPVIRLFNQLLTLNYLENEVLRKNYGDPRIHFALVCAAKGCPAILDVPYAGEQLDRQLDQQASKFLQNTQKNFVDVQKKTLHLSPIFQWYEPDFKQKSGSVQVFVQRYLPSTQLAGYQIVYTFYDWSLNGL